MDKNKKTKVNKVIKGLKKASKLHAGQAKVLTKVIKKIMKNIKDQLAGIAALIAAVVAIGGGFATYGKLTEKINVLESRSTTDYSAQIAVLEEKVEALSVKHGHMNIQINKKEIELLKVQIEEIKVKSSNPLATN